MFLTMIKRLIKMRNFPAVVQCHLYAVAASALPRFLNSHCCYTAAAAATAPPRPPRHHT